MTSRQLTLQEQATSCFTHAMRITYLDLNTTAGVTKTIPIFPESGTAPAGTGFRGPFAWRLHTPFVGGAISALTCACGDGSVVNRIAIAQDLFTPALSGLVIMGLQNVATMPYAFTVADTLDVLFTATGGNLTLLTAGDVEIFFSVISFGPLDTSPTTFMAVVAAEEARMAEERAAAAEKRAAAAKVDAGLADAAAEKARAEADAAAEKARAEADAAAEEAAAAEAPAAEEAPA